MQVRNKVQLITYPDGLGGNLRSLGQVVDEHFPGLFQGGIHVLPPFPSSGDRGFAPLTYDEVDPRFGSWDDIRKLSERHDILLDMMVNHVSSRSPYFQDFLAKGRASEWADLFITLDKVWADGVPVQEDVDKIFLRRPRPWSTFQAGTPAATEGVWTTFGKTDPSEQIDMDWRSSCFRSIVAGFFDRFSSNGVKIVRLDAVGYLAKRAGTSCFFVQPETGEILSWLEGLAEQVGMALLPEVHGRQEVQRYLARRGSWMYDFILPYRILESLVLRSPVHLAAYLAERPHHQFTMLDCHDGIPLKPDLDGLYDGGEVRRVVEVCLARGGNLSLVYSPEHRDSDGFDVHQIRGTFYSLLDRDDDAYIAARAIQLFAPGVPQIYYVGLLAGENDLEAVSRTGDGREINRHNFSLDEIRAAAGRSVVMRLERLIRLRNSHPAFDGDFEVLISGRDRMRLVRHAGDQSCLLEVNLRSFRTSVTLTDARARRDRILL
jgi:sucrose 6(F)-phosphate phosphorylase